MQRVIDKSKLKKILITRTAIKNNKSETLVEQILDFVHRDAIKQFVDNNTIELTGFGKFIFSEKKAKNRLLRLALMKNKIQNKMDKAQTETKILFYLSQVERIEEEEKMIKRKLNE